MRTIGKVVSYDGRFGTILDGGEDLVDFEQKDLSLPETIEVEDQVEFRKETRFDGEVFIARNIKVLAKSQKTVH